LFVKDKTFLPCVRRLVLREIGAGIKIDGYLLRKRDLPRQAEEIQRNSTSKEYARYSSFRCGAKLNAIGYLGAKRLHLSFQSGRA
jgi:hypothetical protein